MNSLEFIEKEIKSDEEFIKILRRDAQLGFKWENVDIEFFEKRIAHLQQIKTILEAWGSVKALIHNSNGVYLLRVDSDDEDDKEHYKRIEKALEVEECEK